MATKEIYNKEKAFAFSGQVSSQVSVAIRDAVHSRGPKYAEALMDIPLKKASGTTLQRATLFSAVLQDSGKDWTRHVRAAASLELLVSYMYLHNRIYDNKGGINFSDPPTVGRHILAGNLCRELACSVLRHDAGPDTERVFRWASEVFDYGQVLAFDSRQAFEGPQERMDTLMLMLKRTYCINAAYFQGIGALAGAVSGASPERIDMLARWSYGFGMLVQFVNDIADFVPSTFGESTVEKVPDDAFADFRKKELSLVHHRLIHAGADFSSEESCLASAGSSGVIRSSMRLCRSISRALGKWAMDEGMETLAGTSFLGISNKYFKDLMRMKETGRIQWGAVSEADSRENQAILEALIRHPGPVWGGLPEHLQPRFSYLRTR